ncbi:MAG: cysteine--tRNA ligase [Planctomycetota bacterium]|nr:cysteine--tRNA ligase [Planctomycetota bacterium]
MTLCVYNTLTRVKEPFAPIDPHGKKVGIYLCGPTVYMPSHVGHMVGPIIFDCVKRYLQHLGYDVTLVVNITDVEDKLIDRANESGKTVAELANQVTDDYFVNLKRLGVNSIDHTPHATDHITEIISLTQGLVDQGFAYASEGDVYFDVGKDNEYGKLSRRDPEELRSGARIEPNSKKRNPLDFALWKSAKPEEPSWDSPWGPGRPGWHIECSAMSMKHLGETFDIHGGGLDLVFPHHENEVAQSECFTGKPIAKYWMHNGLMQMTGNKMSKSKGNLVTITDLLNRHRPEVVRFFLLSTHYRRPIEFNDLLIEETEKATQHFYRFFDRFSRITGESFYSIELPSEHNTSPVVENSDAFISALNQSKQRFFEAMDDDFNTSAAIGVLHEWLTTLNRFIEQHQLESRKISDDNTSLDAVKQGTLWLKEAASILGVFQDPPEHVTEAKSELSAQLINLLVDLRQQARQDKNFPLSDSIRDELLKLGITLEDRSTGTSWKL